MNEPPPSGCSRPGQNQPSAAEVGRGADRDRSLDRLAGVGRARGHRPGDVAGDAVLGAHPGVALEAAGGEDHPAASADLDRALRRHGGDADDASCVVGDQPGHRQVGAQLAALPDEDRRQPGDQGLPAAQGVAAALAGAVPLDRGAHQVGDLGRQVGPLDVGRLDRPPERHPAGRVVVLRERQPLEVEVRIRLERGDQLGRVRQERLDLRRVRILQDRREVVARALRSSPGSRPAAAPGCRAASRRRRSTPTCHRGTTSSRPRRPTVRPWPREPHRSSRRRRTRPRPRRTAAPSPRDGRK